MNKLKTLLLLVVSCALTAFVTAAVVLYIDVKPGKNTFAEAGEIALYVDTADNTKTDDSTVVNSFVNSDDAAALKSVDPVIEADNLPTVNSDVATVSAVTYYVISGRNKYHADGCYYIKNKDNIQSVSDSEISELGLEPCKKCIK